MPFIVRKFNQYIGDVHRTYESAQKYVRNYLKENTELKRSNMVIDQISDEDAICIRALMNLSR